MFRLKGYLTEEGDTLDQGKKKILKALELRGGIGN